MGTQDEGSSSLQTQHQNVRASRPPSAYMSSSLLTQQQNAQVQEMMASAESSNSGGGSPTKAKGGPTKQQKEAAEAAARRARDGAFESGLYQVERMLGQFVCPTHVAAPPSRKNPDEDGGSSFVKQARPLTKAEVKELQRASSDRLYRGTSFAASSAAAAAAVAKKANPAREPRVPPAKKLDMRLSQLRADPAAREALRIKAEQAVKDKIAAQLHLSAGKNFIAINTEPARVYSRSDLLRSYQRPSSAPVGRTPGGRERHSAEAAPPADARCASPTCVLLAFGRAFLAVRTAADSGSPFSSISKAVFAEILRASPAWERPRLLPPRRFRWACQTGPGIFLWGSHPRHISPLPFPEVISILLRPTIG